MTTRVNNTKVKVIVFRLKFIIVATLQSFYKGYKRYNYPTDCALKIESTQVSEESCSFGDINCILKNNAFSRKKISRQPKSFESQSNRLLVSMVRMRRRNGRGWRERRGQREQLGPHLKPHLGFERLICT